MAETKTFTFHLDKEPPKQETKEICPCGKEFTMTISKEFIYVSIRGKCQNCGRAYFGVAEIEGSAKKTAKKLYKNAYDKYMAEHIENRNEVRHESI